MKDKYNYVESIEICEKALDLIDVRKFLIKDKSPHEIMCDIEEYYNSPMSIDTYEIEYFMKEYPEIFGEENPLIFNYMNDDEFLNYCEKRFPDIRWGFEYVERYWVAE